jgi:hypothetical protein
MGGSIFVLNVNLICLMQALKFETMKPLTSTYRAQKNAQGAKGQRNIAPSRTGLHSKLLLTNQMSGNIFN